MTLQATEWVTVLLLVLLGATALVIARLRGLFPVVMLTGIYSFLGAGWMLLLDAPDVSFTEASVGAGTSTILFLGTLSLTVRRQTTSTVHRPLLSLLVVSVTGAALIYGTLDMPAFGSPDAPVQRYPSPSYIERTRQEIPVPNVVTAVLASYRGYDTLGETTVVFTAGIGVMLLLLGAGREHEGGPREWD